jgi:hypothetical protein
MVAETAARPPRRLQQLLRLLRSTSRQLGGIEADARWKRILEADYLG